MNFEFSLVIPVWNEAKKIERDVRAVFSFSQKQSLPLQLIVSDDGSHDGTIEIVQALQKEFGEALSLIIPKKHFGKGHAVRQGLLASAAPVVGFMDSGSNVPLTFLLTGIKRIKTNQCQIAACSRFLTESHIVRPMPLKRRVLSFLFRQWVHFYLKLPAEISDPQCGFKVFNGNIARQLAQHSTMDGFLFDLEFYFLAREWGLHWQEFPIEWSCDLDSRLSISKNFFSILKDLKTLHDRFNQ